MKKSLKKQLLSTMLGFGLLGAIAPSAQAQVKGVSYTLSPVGEYVWWEKNTGVSDGFMVGGHLGFGFGEFVELRGTYLQSLDMKRNFGPLDFRGLPGLELSEPEIDVTRWGGDIKLNLSRGSVVPFLTAGTGVQTFKSDSLSTFKNIYVSLGGGLRFVVADRFSLGVQAVNTSFNASPVRNLMTEVERTDNGLDVADYENDLLKNWSVRASLAFYLGGRRPGELTDVDKAYLNNFSGGFSLPLEITAGQLDFDSALPYGNTKYYGAATGVNFGPFVGLRGYYWRAMDEDFFSSFDKLAIYGGEGKFKLSNGQGLTPSINVGGGVIDAMEGYEVDGVELDEDNRPFVSGGLGLDIPLGRAFKLTAYGKALLTSNEDLIDAQDPENLSTSWAYGLSANLILGNGTREVQTEKEESYDELVKNNMKRERNRAEDLKEEYEKRIDRLDDEIKDAREDGDRRLQYDLQDEQERLERGVRDIEKLQEKEKEANREAERKDDPLLINMKPTEFRNNLDKVEDQYGRGDKNNRNDYDDRYRRRNDDDRRNDNGNRNRNDNEEDIEVLEDRLKSIEQKLDDMMQNNQQMRRNQMNYNGNNRNGDYRNYNNGNRNQEYDDRDYRNNDNARRNYDDRYNRNYNDRNNQNRNDGQYDRNSNFRNNNGSYDDRNRNMRGNGSSRNGSSQPETNEKMSALKKERQKGENLRRAYEDRIDELDDQIKDAKDKGDDQLEMDLQGEKESLEDGVKDIRSAMDKEDRANRRANRDNDPSQLRMESDEFRSMMDDVNKKNEKYQKDIDRSLEKFERNSEREMDDLRDNRDSYRQDLESEMDDLKKEIRDLRAGRSGGNTSGGLRGSDGDSNSLDDTRNNRNARRSSDDDNDRNRDNDDRDDESNSRASSMMTNNNNYLTERQLEYQSENKANNGFFSLLNYDGSSAVGGINIGGAATLNLGFRNHFRYKDSNFYLMPEAFFGFGSSSSYGLFANGVYDFNIKNAENFSPYAGAGLGVMKIGDSGSNNTKLAFNIVLGANLFQVAGGRFYVDYSIRNFFKYNQLSAGYRLPF